MSCQFLVHLPPLCHLLALSVLGIKFVIISILFTFPRKYQHPQRCYHWQFVSIHISWFPSLEWHLQSIYQYYSPIMWLHTHCHGCWQLWSLMHLWFLSSEFQCISCPISWMHNASQWKYMPKEAGMWLLLQIDCYWTPCNIIISSLKIENASFNVNKILIIIQPNVPMNFCLSFCTAFPANVLNFSLTITERLQFQ